jgi:hypothetical protein
MILIFTGYLISTTIIVDSQNKKDFINQITNHMIHIGRICSHSKNLKKLKLNKIKRLIASPQWIMSLAVLL